MPDEIQGFPTIKLFPAGAKDSPVDYSGSRTVEDMANFIKENGKYKVDAYVPPEPEAEEDQAEESEQPQQAPAATEEEAPAAEESEATEHDEL